MHRKIFCQRVPKKAEEVLRGGRGVRKGVYINLTFNALRTRMCKRLSLLAINSYLSWCGKRKRRHLPQPCPALLLSPLSSPLSLSHCCSACSPFFSVCVFRKTFVKHWIYERIKLCFVKQLSGIIYGQLTPAPPLFLPPPLLRLLLHNCHTAHAKCQMVR